MRNLDITTLRSFVAVADSGGVTRAAGFLHLTQSAVSMQLKRLEELLGLELLDRSGRTIALTASGEQLLAYARRMVALNDEVIGRLTDQAFEGEVLLGFGPVDAVLNLSPTGDLTEAAANLFNCLHQLDTMGVARIAVSPIPAHGLGAAINDRLRRAAAPRC